MTMPTPADREAAKKVTGSDRVLADRIVQFILRVSDEPAALSSVAKELAAHRLTAESEKQADIVEIINERAKALRQRTDHESDEERRKWDYAASILDTLASDLFWQEEQETADEK